MPLRVLVTGGTGLLGAHLLASLETDQRFVVSATRRETSRLTLVEPFAERIKWHTGELSDWGFAEACLSEVDAVVHAAGLVSYTSRDAERLRDVNVGLTAHLTHVAQACGLKHFLHISSIAAISPVRGEDLIDEEALAFHAYADTSRYARSKNEAEREVWRAAEEGLGVTILNPSVVLGAGFWNESSAALIAWVARGQRFYPAGGTGYVDARDVAAFAKTCLLAGPQQARFILNAENLSFREFFEAVAAGLDVKPPQQLAKPWQAEFSWRWAGAKAKVAGRDPLVTRESARRAMRVLRYDNRASVAAGAVYRPIEQTIDELTAAYLECAGKEWSLPLGEHAASRRLGV